MPDWIREYQETISSEHKDPKTGKAYEFERRQEARGYDLEFNARGHGANCGQRTEEAETVET